MTTRELPPTITRIDKTDLALALSRAWFALWHEQPNHAAIRLLIAQSAFETGWWKSCKCFNLGNSKHPGPPVELGATGRCWTWFACWEILNNKKVWFYPPNRAACFLAYDTLDEGAVDWLDKLRTQYDRAWPDLLEGDPAGYVEALKRCRYFTGDLGEYRNAVVSVYRGLQAIPIPEIVDPPTEPVARLVELIDATTLLDAARPDMAGEATFAIRET